jgi:hypothetical protein
MKKEKIQTTTTDSGSSAGADGAGGVAGCRLAMLLCTEIVASVSPSCVNTAEARFSSLSDIVPASAFASAVTDSVSSKGSTRNHLCPFYAERQGKYLPAF